MKKNIKIYMAALLSPDHLGTHSLDDVYCFPTKEKRNKWSESIDKEIGEVVFLNDEMEVEI